MNSRSYRIFSIILICAVSTALFVLPSFAYDTLDGRYVRLNANLSESNFGKTVLTNLEFNNNAYTSANYYSCHILIQSGGKFYYGNRFGLTKDFVSGDLAFFTIGEDNQLIKADSGTFVFFMPGMGNNTNNTNLARWLTNNSSLFNTYTATGPSYTVTNGLITVSNGNYILLKDDIQVDTFSGSSYQLTQAGRYSLVGYSSYSTYYGGLTAKSTDFYYFGDIGVPTISLSPNSNISWSSVVGARKYNIYKDGVFYTSKVNNSFVPSVPGIYSVAAANGNVEGGKSNSITVVDTVPHLLLVGNSLQWVDTGAKYYEIYKDGILIQTTNASMYVPTSDGQYKVKAYYFESIQSSFSNIVSFEISANEDRLSSPDIYDFQFSKQAISVTQDSILASFRWTRVPLADGYRLYKDETLVMDMGNANVYIIPASASTIPGAYTVVAYSNNPNIVDSFPSVPLNYLKGTEYEVLYLQNISYSSFGNFFSRIFNNSRFLSLFTLVFTFSIVGFVLFGRKES